jgi:DNA-directed RNA polymerase subunit RPC12/RpoP
MERYANKQHHCRFCSFSSDRKYNRDVHETRKHYPEGKNGSGQFTNLEPFSSNKVNQMIQPSPSFFSSSSPINDLAFNVNSNETDEKIRREKERNFNKTMLKYVNKVVIPSLPSLPSRNSQLNYSEAKYVIPASNIIRNFYPDILPKAYKNYNCKKCSAPFFEAFFNFQNLPSLECHNCSCKLRSSNYCNSSLVAQKNHELLLSTIYHRINSEKPPLKMIVFPNKFIENRLCYLILKFLIFLTGGNYNDYSLIGIFKLSEIMKIFEKEQFFDLGEIEPSHWANRAYDSEKITLLEKGEVEQFTCMTKGTFGLIKFNINDQTIYTLSYISFN